MGVQTEIGRKCFALPRSLYLNVVGRRPVYEIHPKRVYQVVRQLADAGAAVHKKGSVRWCPFSGQSSCHEQSCRGCNSRRACPAFLACPMVQEKESRNRRIVYAS